MRVRAAVYGSMNTASVVPGGLLEIGLTQALRIREERLSTRHDACRLLHVSDIHLRHGRRVSRPPVSRRPFLSLLLLESSARFDSARCQPRGERSSSNPLDVSPGSGAVRGLPLFFRASPRTPLRVPGVVALDTLHVLRHSRPMSGRRITELAMFLDFDGCANAALDQKASHRAECCYIRHRLVDAGLGACLDIRHKFGLGPTPRHCEDVMVVLAELTGLPDDRWSQPATAFIKEYREVMVLDELLRQLVVPRGFARLLWYVRTNGAPMRQSEPRLHSLRTTVQAVRDGNR